MKIYNIIITLILVFYFQKGKAQEGYDWQDPSSIITNLGNDSRGRFVIDNSDNIYCIGMFNESVTIEDTTLYSSIEDGIFFTKYDVNHDLLWTKVLVVSKSSDPKSNRVINFLEIEIDEQDNIYPVIVYSDSIFIEGQLQVVDQSRKAYANSTILKVNPNGEILDMYHIKGSCQTVITDIKVKETIYFQMQISKTGYDLADSCSCVIGGDTTIYEISNRSVIGEIDTIAGQSIWKQELTAGGGHFLTGNIEVLDSAFYITGTVTSKLDLVYGTDTLVIPNILNAYTYIAKLDILGNLKWWQYAGVQSLFSFIHSTNLRVNTNDDILLTLNNSSYTILNHIHFSNSSTLLGATINDKSFAIVNYDKHGNIKWKDISKSDRWETNIGLTVDDDNNIYMSSTFNHSIVFGNDSLTAEDMGTDMLMTSYTKNGVKRWAHSVSGPGGVSGGFLQIDNEDNIHILGRASSSIIRFGSLNYLSPPGKGFYFAKMVKHPLTVTDYKSQSFDIGLWPNPNNGDFVIELKQEHFSRVRIYNALGQQIKNENPDEFTNRIQISGLKKGFYLVEILTKSGKQASGKFVVE